MIFIVIKITMSSDKRRWQQGKPDLITRLEENAGSLTYQRQRGILKLSLYEKWIEK